MASTFTLTMIPNNKGSTAPRVMGDEYYVDFYINITEYHSSDYVQIEASQIGLATITACYVTGISTSAMNNGFDAKHISANVGSGANAGKYVTSKDIAFADSVTIRVPAASHTDNIGELRFRAFGYI